MSAHAARVLPLSGAAILVLAFVLGHVPLASAQNPYEPELARLAQQVRRDGRSPRAVVPLIQLWRAVPNVRPEVALGHVDRIIADRSVNVPVRMYARALRARIRNSMGDPEAARREIDELGYVRDWRIIGPFDNEGKTGFDRAFPPEAERMAALDLEATHEGRERRVGWRSYPDVAPFGYVSFDAVYRPRANVCGYAETFVSSERAQALSLWIGGGGATRVWWNGEVVHEDGAYRTPHPDRAVALVGAHAGLNRLLVKACAADGEWGFYLRVASASGEPAEGVTVRPSADPSEVAAIQAGHGVASLPRAPTAPFAGLEAAAAGERAPARALYDLAMFMRATGADDPAEERARQLAARAADGEATIERLALAAELANQRGEAMRFARRALELGRSDPDALLLNARLASEGPSPEASFEFLDRLSQGSTAWMDGALLRASVLRTLGFPEAARARVEEAARLAPGTSRWLAARAEAAGAAERREELIALRRELVEARWDDLGSRRVLIDDALTRGDQPTLTEHLEVYRQLAGDQAQTYAMAAELYEAMGRTDLAFAAIRAGIEVAPEEAALHVAQGRLFLRADQDDDAIQAFRRALALRPQDASTRELLEQIEPNRQPRQDEAYAVAPDAFLERRGAAEGYPLRVLEDLTVHTVFESGLGSQFRQVAVQIQDAEGARQWRSYAIQFDPDVQRVDVRQARVFRNGQQLSATRTFEQQLGEPWYRMYYDTRALVVLFPDLEPGDVVELQYRLDDVAPRNLFHDYFGDVAYLMTTVPRARWDYVLVTPSGREFYFNRPSMQGLEHERTTRDGQRVDHFHAEGVPAYRREPSAPGLTELVPYLHVSTYRTWEEVGRWYWGLIRDQLYADESLRNTVRQLVEGAADTREKVRRIYDWVIRNTRYVALEFGIHGFLPYRVPDIVTRGFGDCKDKASLIYTMLREAGIDARIVLTRTRPNGQIHDLPASLAVFDHAIAYVPELDLYLDGTAEFTGIEELPGMDQGVTVLRVGPDDVSLAQTPVLDASRNQVERDLTMQLAADGSGSLEVQETIVGVSAPGYRSRYQPVGLRHERLERRVRETFSGAQLGTFGFENLDDFNAPVRIRYQATAPQLAVRDGESLRIAPTVMHDLSRDLARASSRQTPLDLGTRSAYQERRVVRIPRGWHLGELPAGGTAESRFGRLEVQVSRDGTSVRTETRFSLDADRVSVADYAEFRRWVEQADRLLNQRITIAPGGDR
ncbi:MAG: DUF3857 domain-containing protein [Sandaracinaceae bacterium]